MQAELHTWVELAAWLQNAQQTRSLHLSCRLSPAMAARCTAAQLADFLTLHLPLAQGYAHQMVRQRGGCCELRLTIRWRESFRILTAWKTGRTDALSGAELSALEEALCIARQASQAPDDADKLRHVYMALCRRLRYVNTAPGRVGYEALVGAAGALRGGCANCQGFSDAFFLIAGVLGLTVRHVIGHRGHALHMWNAVQTEQGWMYLDVSRGARLLAAGEDPAATLLKTTEELRGMGFSWDEGVNLASSS